MNIKCPIKKKSIYILINLIVSEMKIGFVIEISTQYLLGLNNSICPLHCDVKNLTARDENLKCCTISIFLDFV